MLLSSNKSWIYSSRRVRLAKYSVSDFETNTVYVFRFLLLGRLALSTILTLYLSIPSVFPDSALLLLHCCCHICSPCLCQILAHTLCWKIFLCLVVISRQFWGPFKLFFLVILPYIRVSPYLFPVTLTLWSCGTPYATALVC